MNSFTDSIKNLVRNKIIQLADKIDNDASDLRDTDIIPETGYLDSAGIIELVVWLEDIFEVVIKDSEITIENLGSLNSIGEFIIAKKRKN